MMQTLRSLIGLAWVETLQLMRNRTQAFIFIILPLLLHIFIVGVYWDQVILRIPTVILDLNNSTLSRQIVDGIKASETLDVVAYADNYEQVNQMLKNEQARVAVVVPEDFNKAVSRGEPTRVLTIIEGSNMIYFNVATGAAGEVVQHLAAQLRGQLMLSQGLLTGEVEKILKSVQFPITARYNATFNYAFFLVFGLSFYMLQQTFLLGVATAISREKEQGSWQQLQLLPIARWQIYTGKILPYLLVGLLQGALILISGHYLFGLPVHGQLWLLLVATLVLLVSVSLFGLLISSFTSRVNSVRFVMVMAMPSFVLSGFTWPLEAMHPVGQGLGAILPLTWYLKAFALITMKNAGWNLVAHYILYTSLLGLVSLAALLLFFRKKQRPLNGIPYRIYQILDR